MELVMGLELHQGWPAIGAAVVEEPMPKFKGPDLPADPVIPAHGGAEARVAVRHKPPD
jgi:hypothetical protein